MSTGRTVSTSRTVSAGRTVTAYAATAPYATQDRTRWHASSYSNAEAGNCVEVAPLTGTGTGTGPGSPAPAVVSVRDGTRPHGPPLRFGAGGWAAFVEALKAPGA